MSFSVKNWVNGAAGGTPLSESALEDMEQRLSDYSDAVAAGGIELGYAEITADFDSTTTWTGAAAGFADVTGLSITIDCDGIRPVLLHVFTPSLCNLTVNKYAALAIKEGATLIHGGGIHISTTAGIGWPVSEFKRLTPTAGEHTYNVGLARFDGTGTARIDVTTTTAAFIQAIRV